MGQNGDSGTAPRLRVLHLLCDGPEAAAGRIIAVHEREHEVKVIDLSARDIAYTDLVDQIFAHDKVICW